MALGLDRTQIQLKKTGTTITIPSNPYGKLMYYFDCVCFCIEADSDSSIRRLRDYNNYNSLSTQEELMLLTVCIEVASPDKMIGAVFFPNEDLDCSNEFFELTAVKTKLVVSDSFLVGGQQKKIRKIMMFKKSWLENNYFAPLNSIKSSLRPAPRRSKESSCVVS